MTDREKAIKGLECCEHLSGEYCRLCPYHEDITADTPCWNGALAHDALALLKAQEPMTLEETNDADVVRVVRCKDCKYARFNDKDGLFCDWHYMYNPFGYGQEGYCLYGERRVNNG